MKPISALSHVTAVALALACTALIAVWKTAETADKLVAVTVPRAICGPNDNPETALQGQVPAPMRASGFRGFNCNLELIAQIRGDGANWQTTEYSAGNRRCAYHGTASPTLSLPGRQNLGVPVIDITDPNHPATTAYLATTSMLDPWESLKVNERRKLLAADNGQDGGGGPEIDVYDLSNDCRSPQLLASVAVGKADGSTGTPASVVGHEGAWAPDGLTYYGGDLRNSQYYAVDIANPSKPKLITTWKTGISGVHGLSVSDDGKRGYFVSQGGSANDLVDPTTSPTNGLLIYDLSQIQARVANPQVKLLGQVLWRDGSTAQHTINVVIHKKPYVISVDEGGSGGLSNSAQFAAACAAGLAPFPMARIIDVADQTNPKVISRLLMEVNDPANCPLVAPDITGLAVFTYGTHYCSVDDRQDATTLACGSFNSGIRVYDIRDPLRPKEIAYFNPAGTITPSAGSNHNFGGQWRLGGPDWCSAQVHMDRKSGTLWTTCQDNGFLMLEFTNGAWPLAGSSTPPGEQN